MQIFQNRNLVVFEKSIASLFTECRNNVLCPLTRCIKFEKISDIARTSACWNFLRFSSRWLWQSRYVLRVVKNSKGIGFIGMEYIQYPWTNSFFKQLTLRSTFCQSSPARESKKVPRALFVSMQIFLFKFVQPLANRKYHVFGICELDFLTFWNHNLNLLFKILHL